MPDLHSAILRTADLRKVDLRWADLRKARNLSIKQLAKAATLDGVELDLDYRKKLKIPGLRSRFIRKYSKKSDTRQCRHCREEVQPK
jgi:hypothetical protein